MTPSKLQNCCLSPETAEERDSYLRELEHNKKLIRQPEEQLLGVMEEIFLKDFFEENWAERYPYENLSQVHKKLREGTYFGIRELFEQEKPYPFPRSYFLSDEFQRGFNAVMKILFKKLKNADVQDSHQIDQILIDTMPNICIGEKYSEIRDLVERNSDLLASLCRIDLEARVGKDFKGVYPFPGLDIDLPYMLGGEWLLVEPKHRSVVEYEDIFSGNSYEEVLAAETRFGREALRDGRVKVTRSNFLTGAELPEEVESFTPDVVLIKTPEPAMKGSKVVYSYRRFLTEDTVIVSDRALKNKNLTPINNLAGIENLSSLDSDFPFMEMSSLRYPLLGFRMYIFSPEA